MQPEQIKEAIPNVNHRIMFENRLKKYLGTRATQITLNQGISDETQSDDEDKEIIENNGIKASSYNKIDYPIFGSDFSIINVASCSSTFAPESICNSQNQVQKITLIKTVQV